LGEGDAVHPVPIGCVRTLATVGIYIQDFTITADHISASIAIPLQRSSTLTGASVQIPGLPILASNTIGAIPIECGRALAVVGDRTDVLSSGADDHAGCAVPLATGSAVDAGAVRSEDQTHWTCGHAGAVVEDGVSHSVLAFGTSEEDEAEGEILQQVGAIPNTEAEGIAIPFSTHLNLLIVIVE
jgi:hypothetical protein